MIFLIFLRDLISTDKNIVLIRRYERAKYMLKEFMTIYYVSHIII